jgi:hypothetical protein
MDAETKEALRRFGDALRATNEAVDTLRGHMVKRDANASILIQAEITRAVGALEHALKAVGPDPAPSAED